MVVVGPLLTAYAGFSKTSWNNKGAVSSGFIVLYRASSFFIVLHRAPLCSIVFHRALMVFIMRHRAAIVRHCVFIVRRRAAVARHRASCIVHSGKNMCFQTLRYFCQKDLRRFSIRTSGWNNLASCCHKFRMVDCTPAPRHPNWVCANWAGNRFLNHDTISDCYWIPVLSSMLWKDPPIT